MFPTSTQCGAMRAMGGEISLASRDGRFQASYGYERDRSLEGAHTVSVSMNVGFSLEKLFSFQSPIEDPSPVFASPRHWETVEASPSERPLRKELAKGYGSGGCDCGRCTNAWNHFYQNGIGLQLTHM